MPKLDEYNPFPAVPDDVKDQAKAIEKAKKESHKDHPLLTPVEDVNPPAPPAAPGSPRK